MSVAVVTGGASGIGLALSSALGGRGHTVVIADRDAAALDAAVEQLRADGLDVAAHQVDLRDQESVEELATAAAARGPIEVACFNAGVAATGSPVWATPPSVFALTHDVNVLGLVHSFRSFVPRMIEQDQRSTVVVTASMAGMVASPSSGAYSASKAAAIALTKALRGELTGKHDQVQVALLCPGMVKTNLQRTSAELQEGGAAPDAKFVEKSHEALNAYGVEPEACADWVMAAIDDGRFWVLPPAGDHFAKLLIGELDELDEVLDQP